MEKGSIKTLILGLVASLLIGSGVGAGVYFYLQNRETNTVETSQETEEETTTSTTPAVQATFEEEEGTLNNGFLYEKVWVENPTSKAKLLVTICFPDQSEPAPLILMIPGGLGDGNDFFTNDEITAQLLGKGYVVGFFSAEGRGQSDGEEDYNGTINQDGMHAVLVYLASRKEVDAERIGVVSFSYGVTVASGMLARYADDPNVDFYIDWEGPSAREYTNVGCRDKGNNTEGIAWKDCDDNEWWAEREAVNFLDDLTMPYLRVQSEVDHVQKSNEHAIAAINAAVSGPSPWTRVNGSENPIDTTYTMENSPQWLPNRSGKTHVVEYVEEMAGMFF